MRLEKRAERSTTMAIASPFIALGLTIVTAAIIFAMRGVNPLTGLYVYFIEPLTALWSVEQLLVKASPLVLIGAGLSVAYLANVWNIGAEGQLTAGAILARCRAGVDADMAIPAHVDPDVDYGRCRRHGLGCNPCVFAQPFPRQ